MTPEEEIEAIQIEQELRRRERDSSANSPATTSEGAAIKIPTETAVIDEQPEGPHTISGLMALPGKIMDKMSVDADVLQKKGWVNLTPAERFDLMMLRVPEFGGREALGIERGAEGVAIRSVAPVVGQKLGALTRIPFADRVGGALGGAGGEIVAEMREGDGIKPGRVVSAGLSGLILGKSLSGATGKEVAKEGTKYAVANLGATTTETLLDRGELPDAGEAVASVVSGFGGAQLAKVISPTEAKASIKSERQQMFRKRDEAFRAVRPYGVKVSPADFGQGSDFLADVGGKAATRGEASLDNAVAWQKMTREELDLPVTPDPIEIKDIDDYRYRKAEPYREIQVIQKDAKRQLDERLSAIALIDDPRQAAIIADQPEMKESISILEKLSAADVEALKEARDKAKSFREAFRNGDPKSYELWQAEKAKAEGIEKAIDEAAQSLRDEGFLTRLRSARKDIAVAHAAEDAIDPSTGIVDISVFGDMKRDRQKVSGNLEKMADFYNSFYRDATEATRVSSPNAGNLNAMAAANQASRGDVPGFIGGIVTKFAGKPTRKILLSDFYQNRMLNPAQKQDFAAKLARYMAENSAENRTNSEKVTEEVAVP